MKINELSGKTVFLEDLENLTGWGGTGMRPTRIMLVQSGRTILDESYYPGFDGNINLDYRDAVSHIIVPSLPDVRLGEMSPDKSNGYVALTMDFGGEEYAFFANGFSADAKTVVSDIDYLTVPSEARIPLNIYAGWTAHTISLSFGNCNVRLIDKAGLSADGKGYFTYYFDVNSLPVGTHPFHLVVSAHDGTDTVVMKSCVYQIRKDDFQQFLFAGRLGGYVYFPMAGALECMPEYDIENGTYYRRRRAKVYCSLSPVFSQYTGGLTQRASAVLSELLTSDHIYHLCGNTWRRIVIEEVSLSFRNIDALNYGSFRFRYSDEISPSVVQ